jgi:hypothetical protein
VQIEINVKKLRGGRGAVLCSTKEKGAESGGLLNGAWSGTAPYMLDAGCRGREVYQGGGGEGIWSPVAQPARVRGYVAAFGDIGRPKKVSNLAGGGSCSLTRSWP